MVDFTPEQISAAIARAADYIENADGNVCLDPGEDEHIIAALRTHHATLAGMAKRLEVLQSLAAAMYQAAGAYDMPVRFLDVLSAAGNGEAITEAQVDALLPCETPDTLQRLEAAERDARRWRHARKLLTADDIEGAQGSYDSFGGIVSEDECKRADAAIDATQEGEG